MLKGLSEQVADCYRRAVECGELAALSISPSDRQFYLEREAAWLTMARSYVLSERVGEMLQELNRKSGPKLPDCPACHIEMKFYAVRLMYLTVTIMFERAFFHCENCGRLIDHLAAKPRE